MNQTPEQFAKELIEKHKNWASGKKDTKLEDISSKKAALISCQLVIDELKVLPVGSQERIAITGCLDRITFMEQVKSIISKN